MPGKHRRHLEVTTICLPIAAEEPIDRPGIKIERPADQIKVGVHRSGEIGPELAECRRALVTGRLARWPGLLTQQADETIYDLGGRPGPQIANPLHSLDGIRILAHCRI